MEDWKIGDRIELIDGGSSLSRSKRGISTGDQGVIANIDNIHKPGILLDGCDHSKCYKKIYSCCWYTYTLKKIDTVTPAVATETGLCICEKMDVVWFGCKCGGL